MARTGKNQDYFKTSGASLGRSLRTQEKRKLSESRTEATTADEHAPPVHKPAVAAKGAGSETVARAQQRRVQKELKKAEREEVARMVEAVAPGVPADHRLPPARKGTELNDLWREMQGDAGTFVRSARQLWGSLMNLAQSPIRLYRVFKPAPS